MAADQPAKPQSPRAGGSAPKTVPRPAIEPPGIGAMVQSLYDAISFKPGGQPDLNRLRALFLPEAILVHASPKGLETMGVRVFITRYREHMASGGLKCMEEWEIKRELRWFGGVAQVLSSYGSRINDEQEKRGVNLLQLVRAAWSGPGESGWLIASLAWSEETDEMPLLPTFLI